MFDLKFNHFALAIPAGCESQARIFYCDILGFSEIEKPESLKANGGIWLQTGNLPLHIGTETNGPDRHQTKSHPAFETADLAGLREHLIQNGMVIKEAIPIPGYIRFYVRDPFGNRIEMMQVVDD